MGDVVAPIKERWRGLSWMRHVPAKEIDLAMDLPLNVPASVGIEGAQRLIDDVFADIGRTGLTNDEILQRIAASELVRYSPQTIRNSTLRFLCKDYELRKDEHVFREVHLLMA